MNYQLKADLVEYFRKVENPTEKERELLRKLESNLEYFDVTCVHRDDVTDVGFDAAGVDDATMERLVDKMENGYLEYGYHEDLKMACESLNLPKL